MVDSNSSSFIDYIASNNSSSVRIHTKLMITPNITLNMTCTPTSTSRAAISTESHDTGNNLPTYIHIYTPTSYTLLLDAIPREPDPLTSESMVIKSDSYHTPNYVYNKSYTYRGVQIEKKNQQQQHC